MRDTDFFSKNTYVFLPFKSNPKVALAVDNKKIAKNSFKLYNPFSRYAKILKYIVEFWFIRMNFMHYNNTKNKQYKKSEFIEYLETKLDLTLCTSIYYATAKDKVVIQLQTENKIYGYIKFPLNKNGVKQLLNEKKAIDILSNQKIVEPYIFCDHFNKTPYLLLKELVGESIKLEQNEVTDLLKKFIKKDKYLLKDHPRINNLKNELIKEKLVDCSLVLNGICAISKKMYSEVYEHGDFAPWNVIKQFNSCIPFDFEFFEEIGLEYLDLIMYYFQIGRLLNKFNGKKLIHFIEKSIKVTEIRLLIQIFLIKQILKKSKDYESFTWEIELLNIIYDDKT